MYIGTLEEKDWNFSFFSLFSQLVPSHNNLQKKFIDWAENTDFETLKEKLKSENSQIFLAKNDSNNIIGIICVYFLNQIGIDFYPQAYISHLIVHKGYRSQGIGDQLIEVASLWARSKGCENIQVSCLEKNVLFYQKKGFDQKRFLLGKNISKEG